MMNLFPPKQDTPPKHKISADGPPFETRVFAGCNGKHCAIRPEGGWLDGFHTSHRHSSPIYNRWLNQRSL